jgi:hypothetical protein
MIDKSQRETKNTDAPNHLTHHLHLLSKFQSAIERSDQLEGCCLGVLLGKKISARPVNALVAHQESDPTKIVVRDGNRGKEKGGSMIHFFRFTFD